MTREEVQKILEEVGEYVGSPSDSADVIVKLCTELLENLHYFGHLFTGKPIPIPKDSPDYAHPIVDVCPSCGSEQIGNCEWCGTELYKYEEIRTIVIYDPERAGQFDKTKKLDFCSLKHMEAWQNEHPAE